MPSSSARFVPPDATHIAQALGRDAPEWLSPLMRSHKPMYKPGRDDWNHGRKPKGQSFEAWRLATAPMRAKGRGTIYLQPLGDFHRETLAPSLEHLRTWAEAYFQVAVRVLPGVASDSSIFGGLTRRAADPDQNALDGIQLGCGSVFKALRKCIPPDAICVAAVTMYDLYSSGFNFLFGKAMLKGRVGVFSFARYYPGFYGLAAGPHAESELLWRSCMVMCHEITHMFNVQHCIYHQCRMNGSNSEEESARRPADLCPICLRKMQHSLGFDPHTRYMALVAAARALADDIGHGWKRWRTDASWLAEQCQLLAPAAAALPTVPALPAKQTHEKQGGSKAYARRRGSVGESGVSAGGRIRTSTVALPLVQQRMAPTLSPLSPPNAAEEESASRSIAIAARRKAAEEKHSARCRRAAPAPAPEPGVLAQFVFAT